MAPGTKKPGAIDRPPGHRLEKPIALHAFSQDDSPARPWHRDHVVHAARAPFVSGWYQYRACKAHAANCCRETAGRKDLQRIDLPTVPPAHPAERRPVGWRYFVMRAKRISQLLSQHPHERRFAAIRARSFGRAWAVKVMAVERVSGINEW